MSKNPIEPALRGTRYGAALEAAAQDEAAKREARALEISAAARAHAEQMRRAAGRHILARATSAAQITPLTEADYAARLTPTQVSILQAGLDAVHFRLTRAQANQNSARLADWELIMPIKRGLYTLTDAGRRVHALWVAAQPPGTIPQSPTRQLSEV